MRYVQWTADRAHETTTRFARTCKRYDEIILHIQDHIKVVAMDYNACYNVTIRDYCFTDKALRKKVEKRMTELGYDVVFVEDPSKETKSFCLVVSWS